MHDLTGDKDAVLRVLAETIKHLGLNHPRTARVGIKTLSLRSASHWPGERDEIVSQLQRAYERARNEEAKQPAKLARRGRPQKPWYTPRDRTIALLQSAMDEYLDKRAAKIDRAARKAMTGLKARKPAPVSEPVAMKALFGEQFDTVDPGWIEVVLEQLKQAFQKKARFITHSKPADFRFQLADHARIAIVGDWGGGNDAARLIAQQIKAHDPDHVIHLGDVYYAGTEKEVKNRFLKLWSFWQTPDVPGRSLSLNSNHEMYSGGHAYFNVTLKAFKQPASYFSLGNAHWRFIGLDTAYVDHNLNKEQADWLKAQLGDGFARNILLSHHQLFSAYEQTEAGLETWLNPYLEAGKLAGWFWGHEHLMVIYDPFKGMNARCIGNGCFPYDVPPLHPPLPGFPVAFVNRRKQPNNRGIHSFALLTVDGANLHADYIDEDGTVSYMEDW